MDMGEGREGDDHACGLKHGKGGRDAGVIMVTAYTESSLKGP